MALGGTHAFFPYQVMERHPEASADFTRLRLRMVRLLIPYANPILNPRRPYPTSFGRSGRRNVCAGALSCWTIGGASQGCDMTAAPLAVSLLCVVMVLAGGRSGRAAKRRDAWSAAKTRP